MTGVFLALGSNLGDREANLRRAVELLPSYGVRVVEQSPVYRHGAGGRAAGVGALPERRMPR